MAVQVFDLSRDEFKRLLGQRTLRSMNKIKGDHDYILVQTRVSYTMSFHHDFKVSLEGDYGYCDWQVYASREFDTLDDAQTFADRYKCNDERLIYVSGEYNAIAWEIWHLVDVLDYKSYDVEPYPVFPFEPMNIVLIPSDTLFSEAQLYVHHIALVRRYEYFTPGMNRLDIRYEVLSASRNPQHVFRQIARKEVHPIGFQMQIPYPFGEAEVYTDYCIISDELWFIEDARHLDKHHCHWLDRWQNNRYDFLHIHVDSDGFSVNPYCWREDPLQRYQLHGKGSRYWQPRENYSFALFFDLSFEHFSYVYPTKVTLEDMCHVYDALMRIGKIYHDFDDNGVADYYIDAFDRDYYIALDGGDFAISEREKMLSSLEELRNAEPVRSERDA